MTTPRNRPITQTALLPQDCLHHINLDVRSARKTHDFLKEIFTVPAREGRILMLPDDDDEDHAAFVLPYVAVRFTSSSSSSENLPPQAPGRPTGPSVQLAVLVTDAQEVRYQLIQKGVEYRDLPVGPDGAEWFEFLDLDGYCWTVARLAWEVRQGPDWVSEEMGREGA